MFWEHKICVRVSTRVLWRRAIKSNQIKFICDTRMQTPMKEVKHKVMCQQDTTQQRAALTGALIEQEAQLSQRDRAAGCVIVFAKSRRLELVNNMLRTLGYRSIFNHCDIIRLTICRIRWKKYKIRVITVFKVIQGHRGRYQSKARMRSQAAR